MPVSQAACSWRSASPCVLSQWIRWSKATSAHWRKGKEEREERGMKGPKRKMERIYPRLLVEFSETKRKVPWKGIPNSGGCSWPIHKGSIHLWWQEQVLTEPHCALAGFYSAGMPEGLLHARFWSSSRAQDRQGPCPHRANMAVLWESQEHMGTRTRLPEF